MATENGASQQKPLDVFYSDTRYRCLSLTSQAIAISKKNAEKEVEDQKQFWAALLFTKICVAAKTIVNLCPDSDVKDIHKNHWDSSSVAALSRSFAELYFVFFYLCIDKTEEPGEWLTRLNLIQLRDNKSRLQMFSEWDATDNQEVGFQQHHEDLVSRLKSRKFFLGLAPNRQKELLKGEKALLLTQDEILNRMGEQSKGRFRGLYKYFSAHVHSMPLSFYRMADSEHGRSFETDGDKMLMSACLEHAEWILRRAVGEMQTLFSEKK